MQTEPLSVQLYPIDYHSHERVFISQPHRHTVTEIFYFIIGQGTHYIDFTSYPILNNSAFLIAPQQVHYIEAPAHSHNLGYVIAFDKNVFDFLEPDCRTLFGSFTQPPTYQLPDAALPMLRVLFDQLTDELTAQRPYRTQLIKLLIDCLLTYVLRANALNPNLTGLLLSDSNAAFSRFATCLEANYDQLHTVMAYADQLAMTSQQLNRLCRRVRGQSALAVIHERITLEAKRLLFYGDEPIKEIAYRLGFSEPAHFTHFFRRQTSLSPETFRGQMNHIRK
ncbi:MAG: helix-turn-helix domain-containing protein [Bacteroidetes bacterium]|nr:helix-turn-helix domain-containing protein [Fibrella sp.]